MTYILFDGDSFSNWHHCRGCGNRSEMQLICEGNYVATVEEPYYYLCVYRVLRCHTCDSVSIYLYTSQGNIEKDLCYNSERDGPRERFYVEHVIIEPPRERDISIPLAIAEITNQAESVANVSPRAAFILCRAALEEVCNDLGISATSVSSRGKSKFINLKERLRLLFEKEGLSQELQEIIDGVRDLGNEGAHGQHQIFTRDVSSEDATVLLSLLDYVLQRLYVDKERARMAAVQLAGLQQKIRNSKVSTTDISGPQNTTNLGRHSNDDADDF